MKQQHTPGPWRVSADGVEVGSADSFKPFGGCGCCGSPWMTADDPEVAKADARLIAAAPELLEALQLAVRQNEHDMVMTGDELRLARAAIAKATQ